MNQETEKRELDEHRNNKNPDITMSIKEIVTLATKGFITCEEDSLATGAFCASRKYSGDETCQCIRAAFPTQEYYELYKLLREYYLQKLGTGILARLAGEHLEDNKND